MKSDECDLSPRLPSIHIFAENLAMYKSQEELQAYAVRMRTRGDSYRSIYGYLQNQGAGDNLIKEIMRHVDQMEVDKKIEIKSVKRRTIPARSVILGLIFLISGGALLPYLWGMGIVSTVPFIMMGIGLLGVAGAIK